ncbi:GGDEF domain-containing protein [Desulfospira joergensenii]|uniref:GGDEF domain-containing protein n=1 Tax=Desulfospira joergensenii TaxID=53329 RepID=UPI0003B4BB11|nr:GGDEF domain-containing protein [Desulfospira joergensenii]
MNQTIEKVSARILALLSLAFGQKTRQVDHARLTRHIVALNQKDSSTEIINEVASCLKKILDYRLFAFAVKKKERVEVWLDPRMYKKSIEDIIVQDFHLEGTKDLTYINHNFDPHEIHEEFGMDDLVFYELKEENCYARLYMLPQKKFYPFHDEMVNLILQGCATALSKQLKMENLKNAAVIDPLTGCYNRREFESQLTRNLANARRHGNSLSLFMFDLDHFKQINDTHGHLAGDMVLKQVAGLVKKSMRQGDILARYGGEEFIAILPETGKTKAMDLADRLRSEISNLCLPFDNSLIRVTASFGVSELTPDKDMTMLIQDADTMLYKAKLNGRNTVMPGLFKVCVTRETCSKEDGFKTCPGPV